MGTQRKATQRAATRNKHVLPEPMKATMWQAGQSGNPAGRQKGVRNKLSEAFITDVLQDWQKGGTEAIVKCREEDPAAYLRVVASLIPKEFKLTEGESALDAILDKFDSEQLEQLIVGIAAIGVAGKGKAQEIKTIAGSFTNGVH